MGDDTATDQVYNVAYGERTSLNELFGLIRSRVQKVYPAAAGLDPEYRDFRAGDVLHSLADISKARELIGYSPMYSITTGLDQAAGWYLEKLSEET